MPGRFFLSTPLAEISRQVGATLDERLVEGPRLNIAPGQEIGVLTADRRLRPMRWGVIPVGRVNARGRPVMETIVNARGETVFDKSAFAGISRGVVPVDGWYEWTGAARRKQAWRIRRQDGGIVWFAAIVDVWNGPGGVQVPQVATVTCPPSGDVAAIHDRMGVILAPASISDWLDGSEDMARGLIHPSPDGTLRVEAADDVDWAAP